MKRMVVIGVLVLILALIGGPAFAAQLGEGSVLPAQEDTEALPTSTSRSARASQSSMAVGPVLADTGLGLGDGALLVGGLFAAGGLALVTGRRRAAR